MWFDTFFYIMQTNKKCKIEKTRQMKATTEKVLISLSFGICFLMFLSVMIHNCDEDLKGKGNNNIWLKLVAFKGCDWWSVSSIFSFEVWQNVMTLLTVWLYVNVGQMTVCNLKKKIIGDWFFFTYASFYKIDLFEAVISGSWNYQGCLWDGVKSHYHFKLVFYFLRQKLNNLT